MKSKEEKSLSENNKETAFVISPIGKKGSPERRRADQILNHIIKPIVTQFNYNIIRADDISEPGIITTQIINHLIEDSLVIADLTSHNPNVFYELAVRHAIKKPVIQMINRGEKIPFDISIQRTIEIDHQDLDSVAEAKKKLQAQIAAVKKNPKLVDSPISTAVDFQVMKQSSDPETKAIAEFRSILQYVYLAVSEIRDELRNSESPLRTFPTSDELLSFILPRDLERWRRHYTEKEYIELLGDNRARKQAHRTATKKPQSKK